MKEDLKKSFIYPLLWALLISVIMFPIARIDNLIFNEFSAGWMSASAFWIGRGYYKIDV